MTLEITLPRQSEKLDESLITFWQVAEGDSVEKGEPMVEVQTEKAVTEVQAPESGVIKDIVKKRGDTVKVGEVLAVMDIESKQSAENNIPGEKSETLNEEKVRQDAPEAYKKATPRVKKLAKELDVDWKLVTPSGSGGKVTEEDVQKFVEKSDSSEAIEEVKDSKTPGRQILATPSIRKFARDNDMTVEKVQQSYISDGKKVEIENAKVDEEPESELEQTMRRVPLTSVRKAIARTMVHSRSTIPHVTHFDEVNVEKLVELRGMLKNDFAEDGVKLTYMAFIIKALTNMLHKYPFLNASFDEENEEVILKSDYHIGFAADTDQGLLVPVIKEANRKSLFYIAGEIQSLAAKAKDGKLSSEEMADGTSTISNVGSANGSFFTPIINPPESSILGIGRIEKKAIVTDDDTIEIQPRMALSLSYDHRLIDGVMAQEAMNELKRFLEEPGLLLAY